MEVTAPSGEHYRMLIWTAPLRDADGRITQVMEMSTDVTRVRQLQDQLASLVFGQPGHIGCQNRPVLTGHLIPEMIAFAMHKRIHLVQQIE